MAAVRLPAQAHSSGRIFDAPRFLKSASLSPEECSIEVFLSLRAQQRISDQFGAERRTLPDDSQRSFAFA